LGVGAGVVELGVAVGVGVPGSAGASERRTGLTCAWTTPSATAHAPMPMACSRMVPGLKRAVFMVIARDYLGAAGAMVVKGVAGMVGCMLPIQKPISGTRSSAMSGLSVLISTPPLMSVTNWGVRPAARMR